MKKLTNKKIVLLLSSIFVFTMFLSGCNNDSSSDDNLVWDKYSNDYLQFKYPGKWDVSTNTSSYEGEIVAIVSENSDKAMSEVFDDGYITDSETYILPIIFSISGSMNTDPISFEERKKDMQQFLEERRSESQNFTIERNVHEIEIDNKRALSFVLSGKVDPIGEGAGNSKFPDNIKAKYIILPNYNQKNLNLITYYTTQKQYDEHLDLFKEMVDSINY